MRYSEFRKRSTKDTDAWVEVLVFDVFALPLSYIIYMLFGTKATPYVLTVLTFVLRALGGMFFLSGAIVPGVVSIILAFIMDDIDGQVSRGVFGKDPQVRGTLDFVFDFASMLVVFIGLVPGVLAAGDIHVLYYVTFLASFIMFMALTSTKFRLYSLQGINPDVPLVDTGKISGGLLSLINTVQGAFARFKLVMHPSIVDALAILYIVFPLSGFNLWVLISTIVIIWIDIVISGAVPLYFLLKNETKKQ